MRNAVFHSFCFDVKITQRRKQAIRKIPEKNNDKVDLNVEVKKRGLSGLIGVVSLILLVAVGVPVSMEKQIINKNAVIKIMH